MISPLDNYCDNRKHGAMRNGYFDPAYTIIEKLGGIQAAMRASGASETRVCRWRLSKQRGGTDGLIPVKYHQRLLDWANEQEITLTPKDFFVIPRTRDDPDTGRAVIAA